MTDLASTKGPQSGKATKNSVQERLLALQLKKNQARVLAHKATEDEKEEKEMGPNALQKKERLAAKERKEQFEKKLAEEGDDPERYQRLHRTEVNDNPPHDCAHLSGDVGGRVQKEIEETCPQPRRVWCGSCLPCLQETKTSIRNGWRGLC